MAGRDCLYSAPGPVLLQTASATVSESVNIFQQLQGLWTRVNMSVYCQHLQGNASNFQHQSIVAGRSFNISAHALTRAWRRRGGSGWV
eukprot:6796663-Prymnesium_polylepis.1